MSNITRKTQFGASFVLLFMLSALSTGCGATNESPVDVSGNISIAGKPLNQGSVIFTDEKGQRAYGSIQADGTFLVPQVMPGTFRVAVSVPQRRRVSGDNADPVRGARPLPVPVPTRYSNADSSGLQYEIHAEKAQLSIELAR